jgi:hypothetical protein
VVVPLGEILRAWLGGGPALMLYGLMLIVIVLAAPHGVHRLLQRHRRPRGLRLRAGAGTRTAATGMLEVRGSRSTSTGLRAVDAASFASTRAGSSA